jgi:hypothetical protein
LANSWWSIWINGQKGRARLLWDRFSRVFALVRGRVVVGRSVGRFFWDFAWPGPSKNAHFGAKKQVKMDTKKTEK